MRIIGLSFTIIWLLLASCGQSSTQRGDVPVAESGAKEISEAELLQPADEEALRIASACRFFAGEHWLKPLALITTQELAFKREGKLVRLLSVQNVKPNRYNEGQAFYRGNGYTARTMGLPDTSSKSFGLNIQADNESNVLIGRYGVLRCPEKR